MQRCGITVGGSTRKSR